MKRNTFLKILNPVLAVFFVNQAVTVLLRDHLSYETFGIFHKNGGKILILLILIHITLNFNWVKANYLKRKVR